MLFVTATRRAVSRPVFLLALGLLCLLFEACAPARPEINRHEPEKKSTPSAEEGSQPMQEPTDAANPDVLYPIDPDGSYYIGTLYENGPFDDTLPSQYCLEDDQLYRGATHRLGRQNLFGLDTIDPSLSFQTVLVRGEVRTPLTDRLVADGPCPQDDSPERQFRSDWMSDEGGYRTTREKLESTSYLWASSVEPISLLTIDDPNPQRPRRMRLGAAEEEDGPAGQDITLTVQNPLSIELSDLVLLVHYEGGRGKPMPKYEPHRFSLAPGEARAFVVPPGIEETEGAKRVGWTYAGAHLVCRTGPVRILPSAYFQLPEELNE